MSDYILVLIVVLGRPRMVLRRYWSTTNLAGSLGTLDFELDGDSGSIRREGLNILVSEADEELSLDIRSVGDLKGIILLDRQLGMFALMPRIHFRRLLWI